MAKAALVLAGILLSVTVSLADEHSDPWRNEWIALPENEAAIVVVAETPPGGATITIKSNGMILDEVEWSGPLPFVKQYRLPFGRYTILGAKGGQLDLRLTDSKYTYLEFEKNESDQGFVAITRGPLNRIDFESAWLSGKVKGLVQWNDIWTTSEYSPAIAWSVERIRPTSNTLLILIDVPDRRPPPPPPQ